MVMCTLVLISSLRSSICLHNFSYCCCWRITWAYANLDIVSIKILFLLLPWICHFLPSACQWLILSHSNLSSSVLELEAVASHNWHTYFADASSLPWPSTAKHRHTYQAIVSSPYLLFQILSPFRKNFCIFWRCFWWFLQTAPRSRSTCTE